MSLGSWVGACMLSGTLLAGPLVGKVEGRIKPETEVKDSGFSFSGRIGFLTPKGNLVEKEYGANLFCGGNLGLELPLIGIDIGVSHYSDKGKEYRESYDRAFTSRDDYHRDVENFRIIGLYGGMRGKFRKPGSDHIFPYFGIGVVQQIITNARVIEGQWKREGYYESEKKNFTISGMYFEGGFEKPIGNGSFFGGIRATLSEDEDYKVDEEGENFKKDLETLSFYFGLRWIFE